MNIVTTRRGFSGAWRRRPTERALGGSRAHSPLGFAELAVALGLALASALVFNPYVFGVDDNSITIPLLKAFVHPALYPGDYLLAQRAYYYTFLWNTLGLVHEYLGTSLPTLFFVVYLASLWATFLGVYRIAFSLFRCREVAVLAMVFLLFGKDTLGGVNTIELQLNTRAVATPLLLFALDALLARHLVRAGVLLGLAYLVHPLTTHYVLAMTAAATLIVFGRRGLRPALAGMAAFLVVASPILAWRHEHHPASFHLLSADPQWLAALRARSASHMFPFDWGWQLWAHAAVMLALFGIAWRNRGTPGREEPHRIIGIATLVILACGVIGIVGSEWIPTGIVLLTQPLRAFQFMEYFAMIYVAHDVYRRLDGFERPSVAAGAIVIAGCIVFGADHQPAPLIAVLAMAAFMAWRGRRRRLAGAAFVAAAAAIVSLVAVAWFVREQSTEDTFSIRANEDPPFIDVQHWARTHTDARDGFIVPPYELEEFRVFGERTVYADIEDGGLMNANPDFGREWLRRMRVLGLDAPSPYRHRDEARAAFLALDPDRIGTIAREMESTSRRVLLVWPAAGRALPYAIRYRNSDFVVYDVTDAPAGRAAAARPSS